MRSFGMGIVNESFGDKGASRFLFWFGAYGSTHVLVIGARGLEHALECAADWLSAHAPGHLMQAYSSEHLELIKESCEEMGESYDDFLDHDSDMSDETRWEIEDAANVDLTYTESGYLTAYEWGVVEDPTREEILYLQRRHMLDTPGRWYQACGGDAFTPTQIVRCKRLRTQDEAPIMIHPTAGKVRSDGRLWLLVSHGPSELEQWLETAYRVAHGWRT